MVLTDMVARTVSADQRSSVETGTAIQDSHYTAHHHNRHDRQKNHVGIAEKGRNPKRTDRCGQGRTWR